MRQPRHDRHQRAWQVVGGVKGSVEGLGLRHLVHVWREHDKEKLNGGFPLYSHILPLLEQRRRQPVRAQHAEAIASWCRRRNFNGRRSTASRKDYVFDVKALGRDLQAAGRPARRWPSASRRRKETLDAEPEPGARDRRRLGLSAATSCESTASRTTYAVFAEFSIPIVKTLERNVAVRYDHYSDFGSTTNPKVSLRWQPVAVAAGARIVGHGLPRAVALPAVDPATSGRHAAGPVRSAALPGPERRQQPDCDTQFGVTFGGNPDAEAREGEPDDGRRRVGAGAAAISVGRRLVRPRR